MAIDRLRQLTADFMRDSQVKDPEALTRQARQVISEIKSTFVEKRSPDNETKQALRDAYSAVKDYVKPEKKEELLKNLDLIKDMNAFQKDNKPPLPPLNAAATVQPPPVPVEMSAYVRATMIAKANTAAERDAKPPRHPISSSPDAVQSVQQKPAPVAVKAVTAQNNVKWAGPDWQRDITKLNEPDKPARSIHDTMPQPDYNAPSRATPSSYKVDPPDVNRSNVVVPARANAVDQSFNNAAPSTSSINIAAHRTAANKQSAGYVQGKEEAAPPEPTSRSPGAK